MCIREELTAIESQLETTKKAIHSRLETRDRLQVGEGTSVVKQETTSISSGLELRRIKSVVQTLATGEIQEQNFGHLSRGAQTLWAGGVLLQKEDEKYSPWRARLR